MLVKHLTLNNCTTKDTDHLWLARETSNGPPFGLLLGPPLSLSRDDDVKKMGGQKTKPMDPLLGPLFGLLSRIQKILGFVGYEPIFGGFEISNDKRVKNTIKNNKHVNMNIIVERICNTA